MPKIARTSDLTERISFYKLTTAKNANGVPVTTRTPFYTCWAAVRSQYLSETEKNYGTALADSLRVVVRHQKEFLITNDMEITWNDVNYKIISLNPDTFRREWDTVLIKKAS